MLIFRRFALRRVAPTSSMNKIAELLPVANIVLDLDADTKTRLFDAIGALFERTSGAVARRW